MLEMVGIMWECYGMLSLHDLWCILPPELLEAKLGKWRIPSVIKIFLKINGLPQHWAIWIQGVPCNAKKIRQSMCLWRTNTVSTVHLCSQIVQCPWDCSTAGRVAICWERQDTQTPPQNHIFEYLWIPMSSCSCVILKYIQVIHVFLDSNSKLMPFAFKGCCSFVGSVNQVKKKISRCSWEARGCT